MDERSDLHLQRDVIVIPNLADGVYHFRMDLGGEWSMRNAVNPDEFI